MPVVPTWEQMEAITRGEYSDVFSILGMHEEHEGIVVRAFIPDARAVSVLDAKQGRKVAALDLVHDGGFFVGVMGRRKKPFAYQLKAELEEKHVQFDDPYRFGMVLSDEDVWPWTQGNHERSYRHMGVHFLVRDGVAGAAFAVWAPNAFRVSVVGDFNHWDGRRHVMRPRYECGIWEIFVPGIQAGDLYKFEIKNHQGENLTLKADPFGFRAEQPPQTASIAAEVPRFDDDVAEWENKRLALNAKDQPISIYEVHLGSWKRVPEDENRYLTYRELADQLVPYAAEMGFTHLELLPISEFPYDGSWGYQPIGLYAPTSRHGTPEDFQYFIRKAHEAGLGVLIDWVPGHFPKDAHGLAGFDGTHLYEHADPRQGYHPHWHTLIYNYGRPEVLSFLVSNALFWIDRYHIDGLRVDAVASMLYLDYGREEGQWIPNRYGDRGNLEAMTFLRRVNELLLREGRGAVAMAEESSAWPGVSKPVSEGGLGFGYKWNMGWMNDTLRYMGMDPIYRKHHHHMMTFGLVYAFSENFVLPLSHDEVVHGKGSLIGRMPGDAWKKFANLRAYFGFMWAHPGKKLLFMGGEFAQVREWNYQQSLDWHLLKNKKHEGIRELVRDLNHLYRNTAALYETDCEQGGFEWIDPDDTDRSIYSFIRYAKNGEGMVVVSNFTPVPRQGYTLGLPRGGVLREVLNTDAHLYGGSGVHNTEPLESCVQQHGRFEHQVNVNVPPLATIFFTLDSPE